MDAADSDIRSPHRGIGPNQTGPHLLGCQLGKPDVLRFGGSPTARKGDGAAGRGGRRKRTPSCNRTDRAASCGDTQPERAPTSDWS